MPAPATGRHFCGFIGQSLAARAVYRIIDIAAASKAPVFITGESGTGKELAPRRFISGGARRQTVIALNCAAMPRI